MAGRDTILSVGILACIAGFALGQFLPPLFGTPADHGHGDDHAHTSDHHQTRDYGPNPPAVSITAIGHPGGGHAVRVDAPGFAFAPLAADTDHVPGQGHAHLFVNGEKRARLYGPWYHLPDLGAGTHDIRVTLNANDHGLLAANGAALEATTTLTLP